MKHSTYIRALAATTLLLAPVLVLAQAGAGANATVQAQGASVNASTTISATVMTRAKAKADTEIDRRVKALTELKARIGAMTKVTPDFKANLNTYVDTQINGLTALKAKIAADTSGATLRTDVQAITENQRVFALIMPQARIAAAADRQITIMNMLASIGSKLQTRVQAAASAGADVTVMAAALIDLGTKLTSVQTHAQTAVTTSATLVPDQGDKDKMKVNTDALVAARKSLTSAHQDLTAARKIVDTILKGLRASASATSTTTLTQ